MDDILDYIPKYSFSRFLRLGPIDKSRPCISGIRVLSSEIRQKSATYTRNNTVLDYNPEYGFSRFLRLRSIDEPRPCIRRTRVFELQYPSKKCGLYSEQYGTVWNDLLGCLSLTKLPDTGKVARLTLDNLQTRRIQDGHKIISIKKCVFVKTNFFYMDYLRRCSIPW